MTLVTAFGKITLTGNAVVPDTAPRQPEKVHPPHPPRIQAVVGDRQSIVFTGRHLRNGRDLPIEENSNGSVRPASEEPSGSVPKDPLPNCPLKSLPHA